MTANWGSLTVLASIIIVNHQNFIIISHNLTTTASTLIGHQRVNIRMNLRKTDNMETTLERPRLY